VTLKMTSLRPGSEVILFTEKIGNPGEYKDEAVQQYNAAYPLVYDGKITAQGLNNKIGQSKADFTRFTTRHNGGGNLLFADGHVAWFKWTQVQIQASQMPYNVNTSNANQRLYKCDRRREQKISQLVSASGQAALREWIFPLCFQGWHAR